MVIRATRRGFDEVEQALARLGELAGPIGGQVVGRAISAVLQVLKPYPAQPSRTRAKTFNTYVRGTGHYPKSAFVGEQLHPGRAAKARKAGKVRFTSQRMDSSWRESVQQTDDGAVGILKNEATYSGYVLGHKQGGGAANDDIPQQAAFHAQTPWPNVDDALAEAHAVIDAEIDRGVQQIINLIMGA